MKFYRNYIILILFLLVILLVLQKMKIVPEFSDFLSSIENKETTIKFIASSLNQMEDITSVYFIDQIKLDSTVSGNSFNVTFNTWLQFKVNLKEEFSESSITINGKKINIELPNPQLSQSFVNILSVKQDDNASKIKYDKLNEIALSLAYQNAMKKNLSTICQAHTQKNLNLFLKEMGFTEIKIDFVRVNP